MMLRKSKSLLAATAMIMSHPGLAAINDGTRGDPSELFVSVYDAAAGKSYFKDLGVNMVQFLRNPGGNFDLASDPAYAPFVGKSGLVYNVAGFYPLKSDFSNVSQWGYVLTTSEGSGIFRPGFVDIDAVRQKIQVYVFDLNAPPFDGSAGLAATNLSGVFGASDTAYFDGADWGGNLGGQLSGSTAGSTDTPLEFYFVNNQTGDERDGRVLKAGSWTLSSSGLLSFASSGGIGSNTPPVASAGADQAVLTGSPVTLDGSASRDPDSAPSSLTYAWTQTGGTAVSMTGAATANPSFVAAAAGTYEFQLTVSDGAASASDSVQVTVSDFATSSGPAVRLNLPSTWRVGQKQTISWIYRDIPGKRKATIKFAKNGVKFKKLIRTIAIKKGAAPWKPGKKLVTSAGAIQICVKPAAKQPLVCDTANVVVERKP